MLAPPVRVLSPERMDDPALPAGDHLAALRDLARLNRACRCVEALAPIILNAADGEVRLLDVATGSGDVPILLAEHLQARGVRVRLSLCDVSQRALDAAGERARTAGIETDRHVVDATRDDLPPGQDVAICSLFLHHLEEAGVIAVLGRMAKAAERVVVSDLRRSRHGVALAWAASRVLTRSRVVHTDATLSARAAWTTEELREMAERAGLAGAHVRGQWPCRMLLTWSRT